MSLRDTTTIIVGSNPNDGTGEPIRDGFIKVNNSFANIDQRLIDGNLPIVVSNVITSNNATISNLTVTARAVITPSSILTINPAAQGNMDNVRVGATTPRAGTFTTLVADTITSNGIVNIIGNLVVTGNVITQSSSDLIILDSIINLHTTGGLTPLTVDDGKDIGIKFHYYKGGDNHAFLGWANDSGYLEFYAAGSEVGNVFAGSDYGTIKSGGYIGVNTTASTSTTTGAIVTAGGLGVAGNIHSATLTTGSISATSINLTNATLTNLTTTTAVATNFSTGNAQITGGNVAVNTAVATNFSSGNAVISGGNAQGLLFLQASNFSTGNAQITGGTLSALISVAATNGNITNVYSDNYMWANGTSLLSGVTSEINSLWGNAASQATSINDLWSNAASQATAVSTNNTDITNLWSNAASQATSIIDLWSNAAVQANTLSIKANLASPAFTGGVGITGNLDVTGYITATQDVTAYSDQSLKTNVTTITNALATVRQLRGVHYDRVDTGEPGAGVIAQEAELHTPRLVRAGADGKLSVAYGNYAGYFIESIKELADQLDAANAVIAELQNEIKKLKG